MILKPIPNREIMKYIYIICILVVSILGVIIMEPERDEVILRNISKSIAIEWAIELFAKDNHDALPHLDHWGKDLSPQYMKKIPMDTWSNPFIFKVTNELSRGYFVYSKGPNEMDDDGEKDDIISEYKEYKCEDFDLCKTTTDYLFMFSFLAVILTLISFLFILLWDIHNKYKISK